MNPLPTVFISHGSPMHALHAGRAGAAWAELGRRLPKPKAIVIASAHWETEWPMLATQAKPETIHDFGGFPPELYKLRYAAPGAPEVAERAVGLLRDAHLQVSTNGCRGLDHGAWVPLRHMYPAADVPVTQISLQPALGADHHLRVGAALAPLTRDGVLVIGSGHMTHNLRDWMQFVRTRGHAVVDAGEADYVAQFRRWADTARSAGDTDALARWHDVAPQAERAHPSDEHYLPLPLAFAAAGPAPRVEHIDAGVDAGVLAMDIYVFHPRAHANA